MPSSTRDFADDAVPLRRPRSGCLARVAAKAIDAPYGLQLPTEADVGAHYGSSRRLVCQAEPRLARGRAVCQAGVTLLRSSMFGMTMMVAAGQQAASVPPMPQQGVAW
jgi:hypothetical protein